MKFSPYDVLVHLKNLVVGDPGIRVVRPADSFVLDGSTRAAESGGETARAIVFDANDDLAVFSFVVPPDFDQFSDELKVRALVRHAGGTSIDLTWERASRASADSDIADAEIAAQDSVTVNAAFGVGEIELDLSGMAWQPGERVAVELKASGVEGEGIAHALGNVIEYRSTVVAYDNDGNR